MPYKPSGVERHKPRVKKVTPIEKKLTDWETVHWASDENASYYVIQDSTKLWARCPYETIPAGALIEIVYFPDFFHKLVLSGYRARDLHALGLS